jgi:hypothetical protein
MTSKTSVQTIIFGVVLGLTIIAAAVISMGKYMWLVIPIGTGTFVSGPISIIAFRGKSKNIDRECDERDTLITDNAMKTTFYFMVFILSAYWAYDFAKSGTLLRFSFLITCLFWTSFIVSYCVNRHKY